MPYRIRQATHADVAAVADNRAQCWAESYPGIVSDDALRSVLSAGARAAFARHLGDYVEAGGYLWIGVDAADPARVVAHSFAGVSSAPHAPTPLELVQLFLRDEAKGSGLADALVNHTIGDAPAVWWVLDTNDRAVAFFRRHGFAADGGVREEIPGSREIRLVRG